MATQPDNNPQTQHALELQINDIVLLLLGDKAIYWPNQKALIVADIHFGKAATYRALGQPVPAGTTENNLKRLNALLTSHDCEKLIFLGDFLHARSSLTPSIMAAIQRWRLHHPNLECLLVRGNHDLRAGDPPADLAIKALSEPYLLGGLALCHVPIIHPTHYVLAGHVHPVFQLQGKGRQRIRLPCFYHQKHMTLLPAFGEFTGGYIVQPQLSEKVFITEGESIWRLNT